MRIANHDLDERVLIVAEIGNNHEGNLDVAARLVEEAAACGVDAVKFQTFRTSHFTSARDPSRFARLRSFEIDQDGFRHLERLARDRGLLFLSTPLDLESARFLEPLVDAFKIASGDNDFFELIRLVCRAGKPVIVSTGLSDLERLQRLEAFLTECSPPGGFAFLHCVSSYPVPTEEANLLAIPHLAGELSGPIGYSDHTIGPEASLAAVALGARIIEKHFTLSKTFSSFRDHQLSADPSEMKQIVASIRLVERLRGRPEKVIQPSERANQTVARRSIVAAKELPQGHRLRYEDLTWIRPATGLPPGAEAHLLDRRLRHAVAFGDPLTEVDVETDRA